MSIILNIIKYERLEVQLLESLVFHTFPIFLVIQLLEVINRVGNLVLNVMYERLSRESAAVTKGARARGCGTCCVKLAATDGVLAASEALLLACVGGLDGHPHNTHPSDLCSVITRATKLPILPFSK